MSEREREREREGVRERERDRILRTASLPFAAPCIEDGRVRLGLSFHSRLASANYAIGAIAYYAIGAIAYCAWHKRLLCNRLGNV